MASRVIRKDVKLLPGIVGRAKAKHANSTQSSGVTRSDLHRTADNIVRSDAGVALHFVGRDGTFQSSSAH